MISSRCVWWIYNGVQKLFITCSITLVQANVKRSVVEELAWQVMVRFDPTSESIRLPVLHFTSTSGGGMKNSSALNTDIRIQVRRLWGSLDLLCMWGASKAISSMKIWAEVQEWTYSPRSAAHLLEAFVNSALMSSTEADTSASCSVERCSESGSFHPDFSALD